MDHDVLPPTYEEYLTPRNKPIDQSEIDVFLRNKYPQDEIKEDEIKQERNINSNNHQPPVTYTQPSPSTRCSPRDNGITQEIEEWCFDCCECNCSCNGDTCGIDCLSSCCKQCCECICCCDDD